MNTNIITEQDVQEEQTLFSGSSTCTSKLKLFALPICSFLVFFSFLFLVFPQGIENELLSSPYNFSNLQLWNNLCSS